MRSRHIVAVTGQSDISTAPGLRNKIIELAAAGVCDFVIDLEGVKFLDSTGPGVLVGGLRNVCAHDGSLQLICNQEGLLNLFRVTGPVKVFVIHGSTDPLAGS